MSSNDTDDSNTGIDIVMPRVNYDGELNPVAIADTDTPTEDKNTSETQETTNPAQKVDDSAPSASPDPVINPPATDPTTPVVPGCEGIATTICYIAEDHGIVGDGLTDNTAAINSLLASLAAGSRVVFSAGSSYAHAGVVEIASAGITLSGGGTLLLSLIHI